MPFVIESELNHPSKYSDYFPERLNANGRNPFELFRYLYNRQARVSIGEVLDLYMPDIVHLQIYYGQITTSILKPIKERGIPIVQTLHEYKLTCPVYKHFRDGQLCEKCRGREFSNVIKFRCKGNSVRLSVAVAAEAYFSRYNGDIAQVNHFIAPSNFLRDKMLEYDIVAPEKISTLYNFVDTTKYRPAKLPGDYVLFFGRLAAEKGVLTLIEAARKAQVPLVIAGSGPMQSDLDKRLAKPEYENIKLVGFKSGEDLQFLINNCSFTVLPSEWYENMPLSALESMACEKPVVGSRIGGIPEIIDHGVDGYLFEPGDVEGLSRLMRELFYNKKRASEMGSEARKKIVEKFNPNWHIQELVELYANLIENHESK